MCLVSLSSVSPGSELVGGASITPDDDVFIHLAKVYSYNHATMHKGGRCPDGVPFRDGITNGYQWYALPGQHVALQSQITRISRSFWFNLIFTSFYVVSTSKHTLNPSFTVCRAGGGMKTNMAPGERRQDDSGMFVFPSGCRGNNITAE